MPDLLEKLQNRENELAFIIAGDAAKLSEKPLFHYSSSGGKLSMPCALCFYDEKINLFYQWTISLEGKNCICWGHSSSTNLIDWTPEPLALVPDNFSDESGCLCGSVLEFNGKTLIAYTGISIQKDLCVQQQCIAIGNGYKFEKLTENPVVTSRNIPFIYDKTKFCNPKMVEINGIFYMTCTVSKTDKTGSIVIFSSSDLKNWTFCDSIEEKKISSAKIWELPSTFRLNETDILMFSYYNPKENKQKGLSKGFCSVYTKKSFDPQLLDFYTENESDPDSDISIIDSGIDFYAPTVTELPDGRHIMMAMLQNGPEPYTPENYLWSGTMTIPREIRIKNGKLYQMPVKELNELRINRVCGEIAPKEKTEIEILDGRHFELKTELSLSENETGSMSLYLCKNKTGDKYVEICYDAKKGTLFFDRSRTDFPGKISKKEIPVSPMPDGTISFLCIIDTTSIEIFINEGEMSFSNTFYADLHSNGVSVRSSMKVPIIFNYYHLGEPVNL